MGKQGIIVAALDFFGQLEVLSGHFEEHFDLPAFSVNAYNIFVQEMDVG